MSKLVGVAVLVIGDGGGGREEVERFGSGLEEIGVSVFAEVLEVGNAKVLESVRNIQMQKYPVVVVTTKENMSVLRGKMGGGRVKRVWFLDVNRDDGIPPSLWACMCNCEEIVVEGRVEDETVVEKEGEREFDVRTEFCWAFAESDGWVEGPDWLVAEGGLLARKFGGWKVSERVACFDVDGTVAVHRGDAKKAARSPKDVLVPPKALSFVRSVCINSGGGGEEGEESGGGDGKAVVLMSNQGGIALGRSGKEEVCKVMETVCEALGVPCLVLVAPQYNVARKPGLGMWIALEAIAKQDSVKIDKKASFFAGDADGSGSGGARSKSDLEFAAGIRVPFIPASQLHSRGQHTTIPPSPPPLPITPGLRALAGLVTYRVPFLPLTPQTPTLTPPATPELVVLVGPPGAGKSFFCRLMLPTHTVVNQDTEGSLEKCMLIAKQVLDRKGSVVVDATNRDTPTRSAWVALGRTYDPPVRVIAICLRSGLDLAAHNASARAAKPLLMHVDATPEKDVRAIDHRIVRAWFLAATMPRTPDEPDGRIDDVEKLARSLKPVPPEEIKKAKDEKAQKRMTSFFTIGKKRTRPQSPTPTPSSSSSSSSSRTDRPNTTEYVSDLHSLSYTRLTMPPVEVGRVKEDFDAVYHFGAAIATDGVTRKLLEEKGVSWLMNAAAASELPTSPFQTPTHAYLYAMRSNCK